MEANLTSSGQAIRGPVLITGANGHLGRRMIARLAPDVQIRALVRSESARNLIESTLAGKPYAANVNIRVHDFADEQAMLESLAGCSSVIHLVGIIKESASSSYVQAQEETTAALVLAAEQCVVERILYVSIAGANVHSNNSCLASKGRAEQILLNARIPALILRVPMVLGEGDYAVAALKRRASAAWVFLLRGASLEQPIYALDLENALLAGLGKQISEHLLLELAGPESLSRSALTVRAAKIMHGEQKALPRIISLPYFIGVAAVWVLEKVMASPPVTRAMLGVLDHDDAIDPAPASASLGIELTALDQMLKNLLLK